MKYVSITIAIFCAVMIYWLWNDHVWHTDYAFARYSSEVLAWIIGFTGWFNHALDMFIKDKSNEQV